MKYFKIPNYTMKLRLYPTKAQKEIFEKILWEVKVYHNNTVYQIMNLNPEVVNEYINKDGNKIHWINKKGFHGSGSWKAKMINGRENAKYVQKGALIGENSIADDIIKSFDRESKSKKRIPIDGIKPHYYSKSKPRKSFTINAKKCSNFKFTDNEKVAYLFFSKQIGVVKMRGINKKLRYGENFDMTMKEFFQSGGYRSSGKKDAPAEMTCKVSRDNCGDWYISITLPYVWKPMNVKEEQHECGIDLGVKEKAIIYDATDNSFEHEEGNRFMFNNDFSDSELSKRLEELNKMKARKWGYCNEEFRKANRESGYKPTPSKQYLKVDMEYKKLHRYIARKREAYNHQLSTNIVNTYNFISLESLKVEDWFKKKVFDGTEHFTKEECVKLSNEKRFRRIHSDNALSSFADMIIYKAKRYNVELVKIDTYYASSQICHMCGYKNPKVKDLSVREWICPECGALHQRDENAAINIYIEGKRIYLTTLKVA